MVAEPVRADLVDDYADDGRWLWLHRRAEGHGPLCPDLPCSDLRRRLGLPPVRSALWPAPGSSGQGVGGERGSEGA